MNFHNYPTAILLSTYQAKLSTLASLPSDCDAVAVMLIDHLQDAEQVLASRQIEVVPTLLPTNLVMWKQANYPQVVA